MAKSVSALAVLLSIVSLFVAWQIAAGTSITQGIFAGTVHNTKLLIFLAPSGLGALLGALIGMKRFGRGLGIGVLVLGLAGGAMWILANSAMAERDLDAAIGHWIFLAATVLTIIAGLVGIVKPQRAAA